MIVFCQASKDDTLSLVQYEYEDDNLIKETSLQNGEVQSEKTFEYNSENQVVSTIYLTDWQKIEMTYFYNENGQLINILYKFTNFDADGQIASESESEASREYENNQLVKEWEHWGGFSTYEYSGDKVVKKIDYTKNGVKHHITTYKYSGDLLKTEKKETEAGSIIYLKTYKYDSQNRLVQIQDGANIVEENDYTDNKLIEKRTYYFGIDPGFDFCFGNYIYRYEY